MMREEATARPSVGFGFLWKFPSEGSNSADADASFPHRCDSCGDAWVTSLDDLKRHAATCRGARRPRRLELGAPRPYWCEIAATSLEWREAAHALQDEHNQVPFTTVVRVAPLDDDCFQVVTLQSCITFRAESQDERNAWLSALGEAIFCLGAPPGAEATEAVGACLRRGGDVDELEAIVQSHPAAITNTDTDGNSMLLVACKLGAPIEVFRLLLHYGADAYAVNAKGEAPMLLLSAAGETAIVRLFLLDFAVDVHTRYGGGVSAVLAAAAMGETKMLQLLFELGANLLDVDDRGYSTLHCASTYCYGLDTVSYLCGVAPSLIDWPASDGSTGLLLAVQHGLLDIAKVLLDHQANPRIADMQGVTADALARAAGHWDLLALMTPPPESPWIECQTDEGDVFYYNSVTGESSWYLPGPSITDEDETAVSSTPVCLLPLVSPLNALDDPDAAAKELVRRKKERQQRRRRKQLF